MGRRCDVDSDPRRDPDSRRPTALERAWGRTPRFESYIADTPILESELVQLERGDLELRFFRAIGQDSIVNRVQFDPLLAGYMVPSPDWVALLMPIAWRDDYLLNGQLVRPEMAYFSTSVYGYSIRAKQRDNIVLGFRRQALIETCACLMGVDPDEVELDDLYISLAGPEGARIQAMISTALTSTEASPLSPGTGVLSAALEDELILAMGQLIRPYIGGEKDGMQLAETVVRAVRAAERLVRQTPNSAPVLQELCAAAGMGNTRLHKCFQQVYGVSPSRYVKLWRMTRANQWLLDTVRPPRSVKDVALGLGFYNSGRFGSEYRDLFGEYPSDALERTLLAAKAKAAYGSEAPQPSSATADEKLRA